MPNTLNNSERIIALIYLFMVAMTGLYVIHNLSSDTFRYIDTISDVEVVDKNTLTVKGKVYDKNITHDANQIQRVKDSLIGTKLAMNLTPNMYKKITGEFPTGYKSNTLDDPTVNTIFFIVIVAFWGLTILIIGLRNGGDLHHLFD